MVIILMADGFEEIEALTPADVLRRAGVAVTLASVSDSLNVTGSHGITVTCDRLASELSAEGVELLIFPGGMPGAKNLDESADAERLLSEVLSRGGRVGAICAAPFILGKRGLLEARHACCYPGFEDQLRGAKVVFDPVVTDGPFTTARAMGAAVDFSYELLSLLTSEERAREICGSFLARAKGSAKYSSENERETERALLYDDAMPEYTGYELPTPELLSAHDEKAPDVSEDVERTKAKILEILGEFGIKGTISETVSGPRITRYEFVPARGTKVTSVLKLFDDICLSLARSGIRMEAPIPGKSAIGIEVPNEVSRTVYLRELLLSDEMKNSTSLTRFPLGVNVCGEGVFADLAKLPHLIVGGATGMGKSVCIHAILSSMLLSARPDELKLILIDPKKVEFNAYEGIPHLLTPIICDATAAVGALCYATREMERRYDIIEKAGVRNIDAYNAAVTDAKGRLPKIVIAIDELNDLMMARRSPIEDLIMRIAQKARAAGIHLIIGTQRPTVDVLTGVIKANIPSRIACKVASFTDSKTLLDFSGAEKLLSRGDMLFTATGYAKPVRIQGAFISDAEVERITEFIKKQSFEPCYSRAAMAEIAGAEEIIRNMRRAEKESDAEETLLTEEFLEAAEIAISAGKISTSLLQRKLSIGYGKAAKYIDIMEGYGLISEPNGQKPRDVLLTADEWRDFIAEVKNG